MAPGLVRGRRQMECWHRIWEVYPEAPCLGEECRGKAGRAELACNVCVACFLLVTCSEVCSPPARFDGFPSHLSPGCWSRPVGRSCDGTEKGTDLPKLVALCPIPLPASKSSSRRGGDVITANGSENKRNELKKKKKPHGDRGCKCGVLLSSPSRPSPPPALRGSMVWLPCLLGFHQHVPDARLFPPSWRAFCGSFVPCCCLLQTSRPGSPSFLQPSVPHR